MLDDIISLFCWVGSKIIEFMIHGFKRTFIFFIVIPIVIFIILAIVYS